ncbi:carbohydrate diacid regulator [Thalassobacillus cyri]|uniref:Carbohydrate diacid regulator n=1 Tax=Thalassobacillus cyri TaxID=571932 RepID=A0A1H4FTR4_9BACI|nr:sugar diacid recognition domain-containing protein [Thalassobacillus cyri]SEB00684.1 carbohydrate diacid regulator [Thalassobacillus cyri]
MFLSEALAQRILQEVRKLMDEDFIIVNTEGNIIASTARDRIGSFHEGAMIAAHEKRNVLLTEQDESQLQGVKAGINLPIMFQHHVVGVIGITGNPEKVTPFGSLLKKMTELLIHENYYKEQVEWKTRAVEGLVFDWIHQHTDSENFQERADMLGIDLSLPRRSTIIHLRNMNADKEPVVLDFLKSRLLPTKNDIFARLGSDRYVLLEVAMSSDEANRITHRKTSFLKWKQELEKRYGITMTAGIGQPVSREEVNISYEQAERALLVADKNDGIFFDEELGLEMCIQEISHATRSDFITRTIERIKGEKDLIDTLIIYFKNDLKIKAAAEDMHVHINTIHYRFKRIEALTSLDPKVFRDLMTLYMGLYFLEEQTKEKHVRA